MRDATQDRRLELVSSAIYGDRGPDQEMLAEQGLRITAMLLHKNNDYGSSGFERPYLLPELEVRHALLCRMSDKIARIRNLLSGAEAQVTDESVEDTLTDLAGYVILYLSTPESK
jgi:hypothetical protein